MRKINNQKLPTIVRKTEFKLGDYVGISHPRKVFSKGYSPNWSTEIFQIVNINRTYPETHYLIDCLQEPISGGLRRFEIQTVKHVEIGIG